MDNEALANIIHAVVARLRHDGMLTIHPEACESDLIDAALHIIREGGLNPTLRCADCGSTCIRVDTEWEGE